MVTRRDENEPLIVEAIEAAGVKVYKEMRCDLICRKDGDPPGILRAIEIKVPQGKQGKPKLDKRQQEQAEFCAETGTPYVTTIAEAFTALGITIGGRP